MAKMKPKKLAKKKKAQMIEYLKPTDKETRRVEVYNQLIKRKLKRRMLKCRGVLIQIR